MSEHDWMAFRIGFDWCRRCGGLRIDGDHFVVGRECVGTDAPPFNVVVDDSVPPGQVHIKNVAHETLSRRAELIDVMAFKYGRGFQLVERRDGMTTTWTIEPHCDGCAHHHPPAPGHVHGRVCSGTRGKNRRSIDADGAPDWCPRRYAEAI